MTGIERLRKLIADIDVSADPELWYILRRGTEGGWDCDERDDKTLGSTLAAIADQIEREQGGRVSRMRVLAVVTDMERHVSGVEGAEDSPVARWARELREALGGDGRDPAADVSVSAYDLLPQEDREAVALVRERGGLERVKAQRRESMPRAAYERKKAGFLDHIAECERALGRRREIISELNRRASDMTRENAELRKRAMPEGYEWPRFEDGEPVRIGDVVSDIEVRSVVFRDGGILLSDCTSVHGWGTWRSYKEPIKRPAVLAADGEPLEVGQTVYATRYGYVRCTVLSFEWAVDGWLVEVENEGGCKFRQTPDAFIHKRPVLDADGEEIREGDVLYRKSDGRMVEVAEVYEKTFIDADDCVRPGDGFTHRAPVFAADGMPLREGEHVYHVETGAELVVKELPKPGEYQAVVVFAPPASHPTSFDPNLLTHRAPVLASDGKPLEAGQTVWDTNGDELVIGAIEDGGHTVSCRYADVGDAIPVHGMWSPSDLTHQRPVLDADGVPIREEDTVWNATTGAGPFTVREIERSDDPDEPEDIVWCGEHAANGFKVWRIADQLTHTEPIDTWQRIEEDAEKNPCDYFGFDGEEICGKCPASGKNCEQTMARDLVRRCKELARKENNNE